MNTFAYPYNLDAAAVQIVEIPLGVSRITVTSDQTDTVLEFSARPPNATDSWKALTFTSGAIGIDFPITRLKITAVTAAVIAVRGA